MKKTLYLMRHGQTLFNLQHKIQGWCDAPLTPLGIKQAQMAKEYFTNITLDHAYASTSERASDTLEIITDMPYTRLKGLKEWNFGAFEGKDETIDDWKERLHKQEASYINLRMNKDEYEKFVEELINAEVITLHEFEKSEMYIHLSNALMKMSERDKELLTYRYTMEMSSKEISKITGIKESNVNSYIRRAREKLLKIFNGEV